SFVWAGPLANFTPGHQDTYVNFRNEDRAPLLFIAGGEDNLMPPAVNQSNAKHYRHTKSVTDYKEFPERSHYTVGQDGWEEVADYALEWAEEHAVTRPATVLGSSVCAADIYRAPELGRAELRQLHLLERGRQGRPPRRLGGAGALL